MSTQVNSRVMSDGRSLIDSFRLPVEDCMTSEEVIQRGGFNHRFEKRPVFLENGCQAPKVWAVTNMNSGLVTGYVGDGYKIYQPVDCFTTADGIIGENARYVGAAWLDKYARIAMIVALEPIQFLGEEYRRFLVFSNGYNGIHGLVIAMVIERFACFNATNAMIESAPRAWRTRHAGDLQAKQEAAKLHLRMSGKYTNAFFQKAETLAYTKIGMAEVYPMLSDLFPLPEMPNALVRERVYEDRDKLLNIYDNMPDLQNMKGTRWGFYMAVTDYVSHMEPKRKSPTFKERLFSSIVQGHPLTDKAWKMLTA